MAGDNKVTVIVENQRTKGKTMRFGSMKRSSLIPTADGVARKPAIPGFGITNKDRKNHNRALTQKRDSLRSNEPAVEWISGQGAGGGFKQVID